MQLSSLLTDEQLLDICLTLVSVSGNMYNSLEGPAGLVITARAVAELQKDQDEFSEKDIERKVSEMTLDKDIELMVKKGVLDIDVSGNEMRYSVTDVGREMIKDHLDG